MSLPISVVVPHLLSRKEFFRRHCLPSIERNDPEEIFIESGDGSACVKRNAGAKRATQPYLMFVDDDSILGNEALSSMLEALIKNPGASFAYSDTEMVLYPNIPYPHPAGIRHAMPWSFSELKQGNYVETMSLMRREVFPGFDPEIRRFQDWDVWLTLAERGHQGVYVPKVLFQLHHFDVGITASVPFEESLAAIKRKHRL